MGKKIIVGAFEPVILPELGSTKYLAKVDTGAYRGAVHVDEIIMTEAGDAIVELSGQKFSFSADRIKNVWVKSASGHRSSRVVVTTPVVVQGKTYQTWVGLTNRQKMKFPMLIGRYFLRENNILVDVNRNNQYDTDGRRSK